MSGFDYYLIIINVIGAIVYVVNMFLYRYTAEGQIDKVVTVVSLLGGSLGILLMIIAFDRKSVKDNMMSRVFISCIFVIQIIILLLVKGHHSDTITIAFWSFFARYKILWIYLIIINIITFVAYAIDKINAINHRSRIRILVLLGLAFIGGSVGAISAMYICRHKIKKDYFTIGVPLMMIMQIFVIFYLMNAGW